MKPTRVDGPVDVFSDLDGDVIHCKVNHEGQGAVHGISERLLLDFLDINQTAGDAKLGNVSSTNLAVVR